MPDLTSSIRERKERRVKTLKEDIAAVQQELVDLEDTLMYVGRLRAEEKQLRADLAREEGNKTKVRITQAAMRTLVEQLLREKGGELTTDDLKESVKHRLRERGTPATGFHKTLESIRGDFVNGSDSDVWRLPIDG